MLDFTIGGWLVSRLETVICYKQSLYWLKNIHAICTVYVPFLPSYLPIEDQNTLSLRCSTVLSPSASNPDLWHFSLERELVLRHKLQLNVHNGDTLYKRAIQKLARYFTFCKIRSFRCSYTEIAQFHKNDRQNIKLKYNCRM